MSRTAECRCLRSSSVPRAQIMRDLSATASADAADRAPKAVADEPELSDTGICTAAARSPRAVVGDAAVLATEHRGNVVGLVAGRVLPCLPGAGVVFLEAVDEVLNPCSCI